MLHCNAQHLQHVWAINKALWNYRKNIQADTFLLKPKKDRGRAWLIPFRHDSDVIITSAPNPRQHSAILLSSVATTARECITSEFRLRSPICSHKESLQLNSVTEVQHAATGNHYNWIQIQKSNMQLPTFISLNPLEIYCHPTN